MPATRRTRKMPGGKRKSVRIFFRRKPIESICTSLYQNLIDLSTIEGGYTNSAGTQ